MNRGMVVIPAIDLKDGRCVRLSQGRASEQKVYDEDPIRVAERFAAAGAELVHVIDLDAAFAGRKSLNRSIVEKMVEEVGLPIQFGGGIRTAADVRELIDKGVSRVVLGTLVCESPIEVRKLVNEFGKTIAAGIDAVDGKVMTKGWKAETNVTSLELASTVAELGVTRLIYTDIKRDGMLNGPNIEQTVAVARTAGIAVTASGGVSSLQDIQNLRAAGEPLVDSVIVGRALYEKRFTLEEALQLAI